MTIRFHPGRPLRGAADWFARTDPERRSYGAVVANAAPCDCGGRDGVAVCVSRCPTLAPAAHNLVIVVAFSHHAQEATGAFLTTEEAKQLVNRLGEAIAVAERVDREATR